MAQTKQIVTKTHNTGVTDAGTTVDRSTKQVSRSASADDVTVTSNIIWYLLGFVEILLALRFFLKLFGANPASGFVDLVYAVSGVLSAPFDNIFGVTAARTGAIRSVFEPSILVAALVYALIAWGIVKLMHLNRDQPADEV